MLSACALQLARAGAAGGSGIATSAPAALGAVAARYVRPWAGRLLSARLSSRRGVATGSFTGRSDQTAKHASKQA